MNANIYARSACICMFVGAWIALLPLGCDRQRASPSPASTDKGADQTKPTPSNQTRSGDSQNASNGSDKSSSSKAYDQRIAQATAYLDANDTESAWRIVKELMIERPDSPPTLFVSARTMAARGDLKSAIQLISRIDENDPEAGPAAMGQLAEWLAARGDLNQAEPKLIGLLKKFPNSSRAIRLLIDIYCAQGRRWESAPLFEQLVRLGNFNEEEIMRTLDFRMPYENEQLRKAAIAHAPNEPYSKFCDLRFKASIDRWHEAIEPLESIVETRPDLLEPWIWYGESLWQMGRSDELPKWLSKRPAGFEKHPEYWYVYGLMLADQNKLREAARCHYEAIQLDRRHLAAHQALANCLLEAGFEEDAQTVRNRVKALVRIFDLAEQLRRSYGGQEARKEIAQLYHELEDPVGAFAWDALVLVSEKKPFPDSLIATQRGLRSGSIQAPPVLSSLAVSEWALPTDASFESVASNVSSTAASSELTIRMEDVAKELGLDESYDNGSEPDRGWFTLEGLGGGVSVLDFDRDGWPDLFFSQAGDAPTKSQPIYKPKKLYRSMQARSFADVTRGAGVGDLGYGQGTCAADIDQDGFTDLLIANIGAISYFRNQGDGTFESVPLPQSPPPAYWNSSIQAADINGDTLPDIVQGIYIDGSQIFEAWCQTNDPRRGSCHPKSFPPGMTRVLFSQGNGEWELADPALLDSLRDGYVLGILITNLDQQAGNDVFIANDVSPNHWLQSEIDESGKQKLVERAASAGVAVDVVGRAQACMGIACGDQNRDGLLDLIVTNYRSEVSTLYLQTAPGVFYDGTRRSNLGPPTLEWLAFGCQLVDLDNDGWLDFVTLNGYVDSNPPPGIPSKMPQQVLRNVRGKFEWLRKPSPGDYFDHDCVGRGLSLWDYNRDGRPDLVATHLDRPAALLENRYVGSNPFLQLELIGTRCERDAIGAIVRVKANHETWTTTSSIGDGFYGTNEHLIHIGLGAAAVVDAVEIDWPDGSHDRFENLPVKTRWRITQGIGLNPISLQ